MNGVRMRVALVLASLAALATPTHAWAQDLFAPDVLHDVVIRINARDLEQLRADYRVNVYYPADIQWGNHVVRNVAIRSRGYGSRNGWKPGLRVDADAYVSGQTIAGLGAVVLDNLWQDPSMLHEHAAMALFARLGQAAPRTSFARLFINEEYQGVYGIAEEPNESFVDSRFGSARGYLFEYHWLHPYYFEDLGDDLEQYRPYFEPRTKERASSAELYAPLRELLRAQDESADAWRERAEQYIDLQQLVTFAAIEEFLSEFDGLTGAFGANNFYLYRPADSTRHVLVPWDRDNAFASADSSVYLRTDESALLRNALAHPDLHALYLQRLVDTAAAAAEDGWLAGLIDGADALIARAAELDPRKPYSNDERADAVAALRDFAARRPHNVVDQVRRILGGGLP